jgi:hypothetical protein
MAMAQLRDPFMGSFGKQLSTIIDEYKVVSGTVVFVKGNFHSGL